VANHGCRLSIMSMPTVVSPDNDVLKEILGSIQNEMSCFQNGWMVCVQKH
jgi:hypothetical protein